MAIFHFHLNTICRGRGENAVAEAAYQSRENLTCPATDLEFREAEKEEDLVKSAIIGATGVTRSELWSLAETAERRKNAVVGRSIKVALPFELNEDENWELLVGYAKHLCKELGVAGDVAYHAKREEFGPERNDHGHILFSSRVWDDVAKRFGKKTRELDIPRLGSEVIGAMRKDWEQAVNSALPSWCSKKVSCAPLSVQKPGFLVCLHLGTYASEADRKGLGTPEGAYNDLAKEHNAVMEEIEEEERQIASIKRRMALLKAMETPAPKGPVTLLERTAEVEIALKAIGGSGLETNTIRP